MVGSRFAFRYLLVGCAALALSCGGGDLTLPNEGQPAELAMVRGDGQNGTVGEPLADSLVVRVRDRFGTPVASVEVTWTAENGGSVDPATSVTDEGGRAGTQRVLGAQPGTYTTVAAVSQLPESPVLFTTTAVAAKLAIVTQPSPAAVVAVPLERQPVVQLLDAEGNPAAREGVTVTVQIATGGGSLGGATSAASDGSGVVTYTDLSIRGEPGIRTLLFAADAFASTTSAPIAVGVGAPAAIAIAAGDGQSALVNTAVATPPAVVVTDGEGNPVSGIPVGFHVASGGGRVNGGTAVTGADGIAAAAGWTLGTSTGLNTLEARVEGLELQGSPVTFTATGMAGAPSVERSTLSVSPASIPASSGAITSTVTVTARDEFGNPIRDLPAVLTATGSGNVLTQPQQPTDESGVATGTLAATGAGEHVVSASLGGVEIAAKVTVTVTAGAPAAANSSASVGTGTAGSRTTVTVDLKDAFGNPVTTGGSSISVSVTGANTASGEAAEHQGAGRYAVAYTPRAVGTDQITVRVGGIAVPGGPLTSVVSPGPASSQTSTAQVPATGSRFVRMTVVVTVRDAEGNLRAAGGDEVRVRSEGLVDQQAEHRGNGIYEAGFFPPALGTIEIEVLVNGSPVSGSPFRAVITLF